jgi:hypothetical protein
VLFRGDSVGSERGLCCEHVSIAGADFEQVQAQARREESQTLPSTMLFGSDSGGCYMGE